MPATLVPPTAHLVEVLSLSIVVLFVVLIGVFVTLLVMRLVMSRKEARFEATKESIRPLIRDLLTSEPEAEGAEWKVEHLVPAADYRELEQVLLENARIVKGPEADVLTYIFEKMGYVEEDIRNLRHGRDLQKAESAFHLGVMRSTRSVPFLLRTLGEPDETVVFSALNALANIGTPEAVDGVMDFITGERTIQNSRVGEVVLEQKKAFAPLIRGHLVEGTLPNERLGLLIDLAGAIRDAQAAPGLMGYLASPEGALRAKAARALGLSGDAGSCEALVSSLEDPSADVRAESAESLGQLSCTDAIGPLALAIHDPVLRVKMSAAVALTKLGDAGHAALTGRLAAAEEQERGVVAEVLASEDVRMKGRPGVSPG
ncbi:MAG TPA: HEAT repeat domain-containing protein [Candidatus Anoxymicrobiaceae bacterium]